jgi:protein O-mannosyl-transferase
MISKVNANMKTSWLWLPGIFLAVLVVYSNSFNTSFHLDDALQIEKNIAIRPPIVLGKILINSRPITDLTFALNYSAGKLDVQGYHAVNILIHTLAAFILFLLLRATFSTHKLKEIFEKPAEGLAISIALLWAIHPLQSQSVTYVVQRAECLMGLFYLLTIYCLLKYSSSKHKKFWFSLSLLSCALGMGSKQVMVTAPLAALVYDRIFLAKSWNDLFRKRWKLHSSLMLTWLLLIAIPYFRYRIALEPSAGFDIKDITAIQYFLTQPGVILHYLKLSIWPSSLCFDYLWPIAKTPQTIFIPLLTISALFFITLLGLIVMPRFAFIGIWFFLTLVPTSSIMPIADVAAEHRMYLSLISPIVLFIVGLHKLLAKIKYRTLIQSIIVLSIAIPLGWVTWSRNQVYHDALSLWSDTALKRPQNYRAHTNLGRALQDNGRVDEAITHYEQALRINPSYYIAHNNLGNALSDQGRTEEGVAHIRHAIQLQPNYDEPYTNLGVILTREGKLDEAIQNHKKAIELNPNLAQAYNNLGSALATQGKLSEALTQFSKALSLDPNLVETYANMATAYAQQGRFDEAIRYFSDALVMNPKLEEIRKRLIFLRNHKHNLLLGKEVPESAAQPEDQNE